MTKGKEFISYFRLYKRTKKRKRQRNRLVSPKGRSCKISRSRPKITAKGKTTSCFRTIVIHNNTIKIKGKESSVPSRRRKKNESNRMKINMVMKF